MQKTAYHIIKNSEKIMAGHSKWANIKHRKARQDAKREKVFGKLIRAITVAAKIGPDPEHNPRLRDAIQKALSSNMTKDVIERAVKKGSGGDAGAAMEEIRYEGYGPAGVAILVDCLTDNKNRTVGEVRHAFSKYGGNLGTSGSVAYLFNQIGQILLAPGVNADKVFEIALEVGAEDVITYEDGSVEVKTTPKDFQNVLSALETADFKPEQAELTFSASTQVKVEGKAEVSLQKLLDALEDLDDVQEVYSNADF
jgi:YebC/PmpR family DNA-binding regulatory protein